jgi:hypothetical protein
MAMDLVTFRRGGALLIAVSALCGAVEAQGAPGEAVDFARDVFPLLEAHCHRCHGEKRQEGELRLDAREAALAGGLSGKAIVPGRSGESRLLRLVSGLDPDLVMPPGSKRLSAGEIELLRAWIDGGAEWPEGVGAQLERRPSSHWAFQPIVRPPLPAVRREGWARNPIDLFILARLEAEGLSPSPEADPITLLRRLSLDLTGLPPLLEDAERFAAEEPGAYEREVDRLLASPHRGERWARLWLDAARYADTNGYEKDNPRIMWRWRDWVIDAFNRDLAFDRFTIEQLAGDLMPGASFEQLIATGFHRNTMLNEEGGADQEQFRYEAVVDRVNTTGTVFLGLTVGCAQCHSHKYDPISQREYFGLFAFFNNAEEPTIEAPAKEENARREEHLARLAALEAELLREPVLSGPDGAEKAALYRALDERQPAWEEEQARKARRWTVLEPASAVSEGGADLLPLPDGSLLAGGAMPQHDTYRVEYVTELEGITAFRLEVLPHPSLPGGGPGRGRVLGEGNFVLSELSIEAPGPVKLAKASTDHSQEGFGIEKAIDGDVESGWSIEAHKPGMNVARSAVFETAEPAGGPGGTRLAVTLVHYYVHEHNIGRFRLSATADPRPVRASGLPALVEEALLLPPAERTSEQAAAVKRHYRSSVPELAALQKEVSELRASVPKVTTALVMRERERPRETRLHIRGEFLHRGELVEPGVPSSLPPLPEGAAPDRLSLARWITAPENPLCARVAVNRACQAIFGRGLVTTPEDFGAQGAPPSHPELLDWLASELVAQGWSLKALERLIVTSAAYRQSSRVSPEAIRRDPDNVLIARGARFRADAEVVRDAALAASGLLSMRIGGPSVFPPQPDGLAGLSFGSYSWPASKGEDRYRRGLYTYWKRTNPYAAFITFDAPVGETACVRRPRSNTPLQALFLLNDQVFIEAARALAARVLREAPQEDGERLRRAFRHALSRLPEAEELAAMLAFLDEARRELDDSAAERIAGVNAEEPAAGAEPRELAAWTLLARVLLNLDEAITRE